MLWETFEKERTEEQESIIFIKISDPRQPQYQKGTKSNHEGVSASPNSDCLLPSLLLPTHKGISATCKYIKPNLFSQFIFLQTKGSKKGSIFHSIRRVLLGLSKENSFAAHSETGYVFRVV